MEALELTDFQDPPVGTAPIGVSDLLQKLVVMESLASTLELAEGAAAPVSAVLVALAPAAVFISRADTSTCSATASWPIPPRAGTADLVDRAVGVESVALLAPVV